MAFSKEYANYFFTKGPDIVDGARRITSINVTENLLLARSAVQ